MRLPWLVTGGGRFSAVALVVVTGQASLVRVVGHTGPGAVGGGLVFLLVSGLMVGELG